MLSPNYLWHQMWPWQELFEDFCHGALNVKGSMTFTFSTQEAKKIIQHKNKATNSTRRLKITSWFIVIYIGKA
jgi:hypothetical protein